MYVVSVNIPGNIGISVSERPVEIPTPGKSPNESDGYEVSTNEADAAGKRLAPNLGKRPKPSLDVSGFKCLFKF